MRLIDGDDLTKRIKDRYCVRCDICHGLTCPTDDALCMIDESPTIDAIPVEWLKEKENCEDDLFGMCKSVLFMWNRETKTLNKGKAGIWEPLGHIIGFLNHPDSEYYKCSLCGYEQYTLYQQPPDTCPACFASMTSGKGDEQ